LNVMLVDTCRQCW